VSSGKLTSDQATELQGVFAARSPMAAPAPQRASAVAGVAGDAAASAAPVAQATGGAGGVPPRPFMGAMAGSPPPIVRPPVRPRAAARPSSSSASFGQRHSAAVSPIAAEFAVDLVDDVLQLDRQ